MKNLKKMLAVVTAIASMFVSVSAFAEKTLTKDDVIDTFTCTGEDTASPSVTVGVAAGSVNSGEMTFLVLNKDVNPLTQDVAAEDILYIDQHSSSAGTSFTGLINLDRVGSDLTALPDGEYAIRIGYTSKTTGKFAIANAKLVIGSTSSGETTVTIVWGDVNNDGAVTILDSSAILERAIGGDTEFAIEDSDDTLAINESYQIRYDQSSVYEIVWGDVNNDGAVTILDSSAILERAIGGDTEFAIEDSDDTFVMNEEYDLIIE